MNIHGITWASHVLHHKQQSFRPEPAREEDSKSDTIGGSIGIISPYTRATAYKDCYLAQWKLSFTDLYSPPIMGL